MDHGKRGSPKILVMDRASVILPEMLAADRAKRGPPRKLGDGPRKCGSPRAVVVVVASVVCELLWIKYERLRDVRNPVNKSGETGSSLVVAATLVFCRLNTPQFNHFQ